MRVGKHLRERRLVRHVVHDAHRGTVSRAVRDAVTRVEHVADQQRRAVVEAVDVGAGVRVSEVEPLRHLLLGIVGVAVKLQLVGEQVAEVAEQVAGRTGVRRSGATH